VRLLKPHVSGEIIELHHDKHHAAYVAGANGTTDHLDAACDSDDFSAIVGLEKRLAFNLSGHVLHSLSRFGNEKFEAFNWTEDL
jgi:superoxide dismutase, Fe-Mn family